MATPTLLVCLPRTVGHFTVYTSNLLDWALRRGFRAVCLMPDPLGSNLHKKFKDEPDIRFLDLAERLPNRYKDCLRAGDSAALRGLFSWDGLEAQIQALNRVQDETKADWTMLINSEDMIFNSNMFLEREDLFHRPTYGISTFGFRDFHLGYEDVYTHRFNRQIVKRANFKAMFTLDEHHVAFDDPGQEYLVFFPDPYKEFARLPEERLSEQDRRQLDELRAFLAHGDGPLVPLIGKLDARKNGLWLLEQVARRPDYGAVLLGERVRAPRAPGEPLSAEALADERIDHILTTLRAQGRVFVKSDFTTEHFFQAAFESPRVRFAPFAYKTHYGSSAVHLHALEAGKPCLVADTGLMAQRSLAHGLGALFVHDERADFEAAFERMASAPPSIQAGAFLSCFSLERIFASLDYGFGVSSTPPEPPAPYDASKASAEFDYFAPYQRGLAQLRRREADCGAAAFDAALAQRPGHAGLLFRRALAAEASGQQDLCRELTCALQQRQPPPVELEFAFPLFFHLSAHYRDEDKPEEAERRLSFCRLLDPNNPELLLAEAGALHKAGRYEEALQALDAYQAAGLTGPDPLWRRLGVLLDAGRLEEALAECEAALRAFELQGEALTSNALRSWRVDALINAPGAPRIDQALAALREDAQRLLAQQDYSELPSLLRRRVELLLDEDRGGEALAAADEALAVLDSLGAHSAELDPLARLDLLRLRVAALLKTASAEQIRAAAQDLLAQSPGDEEGAHFLAIGLLRQGRPQEALAALLPLLTPVSERPSFLGKHYWRTAGGTYAALKRFPEAVACFEEALRLDPGFHDIRLNLSDARRYAKDFDAAMLALDELEAAAPEHALLHLKRGQVLFEQERYAEALAAFDREAGRGEISEFLQGYLDRTREKLKDGA